MIMINNRQSLLSAEDPARLRSHTMNSFFMERMNIPGGFTNIQRWTKNFDVFALGKLIIPSKSLYYVQCIRK